MLLLRGACSSRIRNGLLYRYLNIMSMLFAVQPGCTPACLVLVFKMLTPSRHTATNQPVTLCAVIAGVISHLA